MNQEKAVAVETARRAGALLRERFGHVQTVDYKSAVDLVTDVDRAVETLVIQSLQDAFPKDAFLGEESGEAAPSCNGRRWIVDPLDGTTNYVHGYPLFSVSIALEAGGELRLGVVYNPILDELYVAERGQGATMNDQPLRVASTSRLAHALLGSGSPYNVHEDPEPYSYIWQALVTRTQAMRQDGSAALDLCHVALGRLDGHVEVGLGPWDVAAGALIVQEAGGMVTDFQGGRDFLFGETIVAANPRLHQAILQVLRGVPV